MRIAPIFIIALLGIQPLFAEQPTVESLALKIEVLEQKVATLSAQVAASSHTDQTAGDGGIVINVLMDGRLQVAGEIVDDAEVAKKLQAIAVQVSNQPLMIRADKETKYQDIVRVVDLCHKAEISNISFTIAKIPGEQDGTGQPAPRSEAKSDGGENPNLDAEWRSR